MFKKLVGIAVALIMLFGVFGLTACDDVSLVDYKTTKSAELQAYADTKGQNNYCDSDWDVVCAAVSDGKEAINAASDKLGVDTAYKTATDAMKAVTRKVHEMAEWTLLDTSRCCNEFDQTEDYTENFAKSVIAYDEAITYFIASDGKFTEDFGGVFVDGNGIHNICVVGDREPIKSDFLIYRQVNNSRNFLDSVVDEIGQVSQEFLVWKVETCESCNSIKVCIESENKIPLLIAHLKISNLFCVGTMKFFVGENNIVLT